MICADSNSSLSNRISHPKPTHSLHPHHTAVSLSAGNPLTKRRSFKCPDQFGYFPDDHDCAKYFVCVFGEALHETCTGGLYFSEKLQTCDWPRNVECVMVNIKNNNNQNDDNDNNNIIINGVNNHNKTSGFISRPSINGKLIDDYFTFSMLNPFNVFNDLND